MATFLRPLAYRHRWIYDSVTAISSLSVGGVARLHKQKVERAGFAVLRSPDVPSLLIETGFISNPREAKRLTAPGYQDKLASAIRRGIQSWFVRKPPPGTLLAWQRKHGRREVTISSGDTLSEIAERYGVTVASIKTNMDSAAT